MTTHEYRADIPGAVESHRDAFLMEELEAIHDAVFRDSTEQPGFYYRDFGSAMGSKRFRQRMIDLKNGLSDMCRVRSNRELDHQWIGRFDHRHTSRFHRDSAQAQSFLMLGYEPSAVDSTVCVADYTKHVEIQKLSLESYFGNRAVNVAPDDGELAPYTTQLAPFPKDHYRLLLLNNSKSFDRPSFGMFHRGEVAESDEREERVINSIMLRFVGEGEAAKPDSNEVMNFLQTDNVDR